MICMYERCTKWKDFGAIRLKTNEVHTACGYYRTLKMEGNEKQKKSKISRKEKESKKKKLHLRNLICTYHYIFYLSECRKPIS